jgi:hypothetical protein
MATKAKAAKAKSTKAKTAKARAVKSKLAKAKLAGARTAKSKPSKANTFKTWTVPPKTQKAKSSNAKIAWPKKTREMHNHHINSTVWNKFKFRDDDIVVATYAKSGTTWTQQILAQLIFNGAEDANVSQLSP